MNSYEDFRNVLADQVRNTIGDDIFKDYTWDTLPSQYPCHGDCIATHMEHRSRRDISSTDPAVLYLPLGGGGSKGCPSLAESAVVGISQMTFLWTVMSVFNVVANVVASINNNQNNRNNNNNNLNINKISTQNTQISANTNNANTISIMLPPPIPVLAGGRRLDSEQRLKRFVERERKIRKREALALSNTTLDSVSSYEFSKSSFTLLKGLLDRKLDTESQDCIGRNLCQSLKIKDTFSAPESIALKLTTFALMWQQLEDRSQSFVNFLENVTKDDFDEYLDCDLMFYKCTQTHHDE